MTMILVQNPLAAGDDSTLHALIENPDATLDVLGPNGGAMVANDENTELAMCFATMEEIIVPENSGKYTTPIALEGQFAVEVDGVMIPYYFNEEQLGRHFNRLNSQEFGVEFVVLGNNVPGGMFPMPVNFTIPNTGLTYRVLAEPGPPGPIGKPSPLLRVEMQGASLPQMIPGKIGEYTALVNPLPFELRPETFSSIQTTPRTLGMISSPVNMLAVVNGVGVDGSARPEIQFAYAFENENDEAVFGKVNNGLTFDQFIPKDVRFLQNKRGGPDGDDPVQLDMTVAVMEADSNRVMFGLVQIPDVSSVATLGEVTMVRKFMHSTMSDAVLNVYVSPDESALIRLDSLNDKEVFNIYHHDTNVPGTAFLTTPMVITGDSLEFEPGLVVRNNEPCWLVDETHALGVIVEYGKAIIVKVARDGSGANVTAMTDEFLEYGPTTCLIGSRDPDRKRMFAFSRSLNKYAIYELNQLDGTFTQLHTADLSALGPDFLGFTRLDSNNFTSPFEGSFIALAEYDNELIEATTQIVINSDFSLSVLAQEV